VTSLDSASPARNPLPDSFDSDRIVSAQTAAKLLGISHSTLRRLWDIDQGPRRIRLSPRRLGVRLRDLQAYLDERSAG
jgi:predicted DNA-binding transcriptional regulator AlpA